MGDAGNKLADYMISGFFLHGHFRLKRNMTVIHFIVFPLIFALTFTDILSLSLRLFFIFPMLAGIVVSIYRIIWIIRAARVSWAMKRLEKRGDCEDALRELEEKGKPYYEKKDVVFGSRYAFFFPSGAVLSYRDIVGLQIVAECEKPQCVRSLPKYNVLRARLSDGKWILLSYQFTFAANRGPAAIESLRNDAAELLKYNATIKLE